MHLENSLWTHHTGGHEGGGKDGAWGGRGSSCCKWVLRTFACPLAAQGHS